MEVMAGISWFQLRKGPYQKNTPHSRTTNHSQLHPRTSTIVQTSTQTSVRHLNQAQINPVQPSWNQKQQLYIKREDKLLTYFMHDIKNHLKKIIKHQHINNIRRVNSQLQERYPRTVSANRQATLDNQPHKSMQINKKQLTGQVLPSFQNKKLVHIRREGKVRHLRHQSVQVAPQQPIDAPAEQYQSIDCQDKDILEQSEDLYLKTLGQSIGKKQVKRETVSFSINTIQQQEKIYLAESEEQNKPLGSHKQAVSSLSMGGIGKIQVKPAFSQITINLDKKGSRQSNSGFMAGNVKRQSLHPQKRQSWEGQRRSKQVELRSIFDAVSK